MRVVVAVSVSEENIGIVREREPRLEIVHEPDLFPAAGANWMVSYSRTDEQQQRLDELLASADALYGVPDQSGAKLGEVVAANRTLRWVHTIPAGGGQQIKAANLSREDLDRMVFTTSAGVHAQPLAEFALFGVMAGAKGLPRLASDHRAGVWGERFSMGQLSAMTVAVVGLGSIGKAVAEKLSLLGCTVIGVHRRDVDAPGVSRIYPVEEFATAASLADAVVLALPGTTETERMLNADVLAAIKPGATVVNVGRGTTVDEAALIAALEDGRVSFAALDVTYVEPLPAESPLWTLDNVLLSPHTAAITDHEPRLIAELFAENARRLLDGEPLKNVVNTVEFY